MAMIVVIDKDVNDDDEVMLTSSSMPRSSSMVLMVTDCLAISTSTGKISPSEDCSFIEGILRVFIDLKFYLMKTKYVST